MKLHGVTSPLISALYREGSNSTKMGTGFVAQLCSPGAVYPAVPLGFSPPQRYIMFILARGDARRAFLTH